MKITIIVLALITLATSVSAEEWNKWNVAPYAEHILEACGKAQTAIEGFSMPSVVKDQLTSALGTTCNGGRESWLTPRQSLKQMWSGGKKPRVIENVTVGELPILKSQDGRSYRKGSVAETARTLSWEVQYEGKKYELYLPYVCFNWSWTETVSPATTVAVTTAAGGACPNGYALVANAWSRRGLSEEFRKKAEELIISAEGRDSRNATSADAYKPDAFSRTLGGQLRREVKTRASIGAEIDVQLRDPRTLSVIKKLGNIKLVGGVGSMALSSDQIGMIVETIWPNDFISPVMSGGKNRLWLFPYEWKSWCLMNVHGLVP